MERFESLDLIKDMWNLVNQNVSVYQSDFNYDKEYILEEFRERNVKDFIWFLRETGTCCAKEREAYIQGTFENAECLSFLAQSKAFFVHLSELKKNGQVLGSVYEVSSEKLLEQIVNCSVPPEKVEMVFMEGEKAGEALVLPYEIFVNEAARYGRDNGPFLKKFLLSEENEERLRRVLQQNRVERGIAEVVSPSLHSMIQKANHVLSEGQKRDDGSPKKREPMR